ARARRPARQADGRRPRHLGPPARDAAAGGGPLLPRPVHAALPRPAAAILQPARRARAHPREGPVMASSPLTRRRLLLGGAAAALAAAAGRAAPAPRQPARPARAA